MALQGNQGNMYEAAFEYVTNHMENNFADVEVRTHVETVKGHGRFDDVTYHPFSVPQDLPGQQNRKGLKTIGVAIRHSEPPTGVTSDVRFCLSSLR